MMLMSRSLQSQAMHPVVADIALRLLKQPINLFGQQIFVFVQHRAYKVPYKRIPNM
jgi:hypothetical protein